MTDTSNDKGVSANSGHLNALKFAHKGGTALGAMLLNIALAKQTERKGPIVSMLFLESHFDYSEVPELGSEEGKTGNKPFDRYVTKVQGSAPIRGSWFTDVVAETPQAADIRKEIAWAQAGQGPDIPAHILDMGTARRKEYIEEQRQLLTDMRTGLTKGAQLWHQLEKINAMNPDRVAVKLPIMEQKDSDGNPVTVVTGSLIRVYDPKKIDEDESVKVGSFLQYDAEAALADPAGATIKTLKATASRDTKKKGGVSGSGTGTGYVQPKTIGELLTLFNVLASALDNGTEHGRKMESQLLSACAKAGSEGDEAVVSTGNVCLAADNVWTVIQNRYNAIKAAQAAALNTKRTGTTG